MPYSWEDLTLIVVFNQMTEGGGGVVTVELEGACVFLEVFLVRLEGLD